MSRRDEMVIRPDLLRREETSPRRRAEQDRKVEEARRQVGFFRRMWRRTALARKVYATRALAKGAASTFRKTAGAKTLGRAAGGIGAGVLLITEAYLASRRVALRKKGFSGRLIDEWDRHIVYGYMDERAVAAANARGFIESQPDLLRIIGQEQRVNAQISDIFSAAKVLEYRNARGADTINRSPAFDAPESRVDYIIKKAKDAAGEQGIPEKVRSFSKKIREMTGGTRIESAR